MGKAASTTRRTSAAWHRDEKRSPVDCTVRSHVAWPFSSPRVRSGRHWRLGSSAARAIQQPIEPRSSTHAAVVGKYCVTCHNDRSRTGGLSLEHADLTDVPKGAETWEKVIRKVRVGMMPPPGMPRPAQAQLDDLAGYLETSARSRGGSSDHIPGGRPSIV